MRTHTSAPSQYRQFFFVRNVASNSLFRNLKQRTRKTRPPMSGGQAPLAAQGTTVAPDTTWQIDTHDDTAMSAIQTSLALLKEGSSLATNLPFIAPIAGLLLQALIMRDEVKQYKGECEIVLGKLARIAGIIVDVCEKYNLREEELPTTLRNILSSLQRELDRIERVLKKCSKRRGIKGMVLRKDLLTKIRQCDVELSNVLQAFQAELGLDIRFALIVQRRLGEVTTDSSPTEATSQDLLSCVCEVLSPCADGASSRSISKRPIVRFGTSLDQSYIINQPKMTQRLVLSTFFFFHPYFVTVLVRNGLNCLR
ncbi:hypothetical protein EDB87DRAFT_1220674 [Lactarius vividus]|nr:hypothetical protein EDB87DRAFT_1220674 [Lactarius vividus]